MPMYVSLVKNEVLAKDEGTKIEAAYFYPIKTPEKRGRVIDEYQESINLDGRSQYSYKDFCTFTVSVFNLYAKDFSKRILEGNFESERPSERNCAFVYVEAHKHCAGCNFKSICRTTFTVGSKDL